MGSSRGSVTVGALGLAAIAAVTGCGSVATIPDGKPGDARPGGGDGGIDAPAPCDPGMTFEQPILVPAVNASGDEVSLRTSPDELTAYVERVTDPNLGDSRLWMTSRGSPTAAFAPPILLPGPVNADVAGAPNTTRDGKTLLFESPRLGSYDLLVSTRLSVTDDFGVPQTIAAIDTPNVELNPYLLDTGTTVYFSQIVPGSGGGIPLMVSRVDMATGAFGPPAAVAVATASVGSPVVSEDELELFTQDNSDIYRATRASTSDGFGTPVRVPALSSNAVDRPVALSSDDCTIYLASDRSGGVGGQDIWMASRR